MKKLRILFITFVEKSDRIGGKEAFRNIVSRMLEAHGRGFWQADADKLDKLRQLYELTDEQLEGLLPT